MPEPGPESLMQRVQKVLDGQCDIRHDVREIKAQLGNRRERVERRLEIIEA